MIKVGKHVVDVTRWHCWCIRGFGGRLDVRYEGVVVIDDILDIVVVKVVVVIVIHHREGGASP